MLRAELALVDRSIPQKVARGRATRDLESVLEADKGDVQALVTRTNLAADDQRYLDASEYARQARAARPDVGYPVLLAEARVENGLGIIALADQTAQAALSAQPGLCDALGLRYELARQRDAVQDADALVEALRPCPGALSRSAEHARTRGDMASAIQLYRKLVERDPSQVAANMALANALLSGRRYDDAVQLLERALAVWPRSSALAAKLADVEDLAGRPDRATALRERALLNDGANLALRRTVERARTGKELLADWAIDGREAIRAYEAEPGPEDATAATVLDAAAVRVYPDGSMVDRTHMIQKALDQSGVQDIAEVNIPSGAEVLAIRTIKPDGTALEPEGFSGKESISLPGVEVGDYVEVEYLQAHEPRGAAQPGFTAASFYYQLARIPNHWSTYRIVAPKGMGMTVDAHNMKAVPPAEKGEYEVFDHEERRVAPFIPEPDSPPVANEYLPFVSVGAGAKGNAGVVSAYADLNADNAQITHEVAQFAKAAAGAKVGLEAAKAIHRAVMEKLTGQDAGLTGSAAASLAQDRGSRLSLMKAALEAAGIPTRIAAVRTFATDPAPYVFPNESLLPYVCLRAEIPKGQPVWLDTTVRFGPFGVLPEGARDRDAYLMPEPGRPLEVVRTPKGSDAGKRLELKVELGADGVLTGFAEEVYSGMEAAQIAEALEQLPPDQRSQAVQGALARYFGGAELSKLELKVPREVGANVTIRYTFRAPRFARVDGDRLVLQPLTFPASLGRRFVEVGVRRMPLYIGETEEATTTASMKLPAGMHLVEPLDQRPLSTPFGVYERRERQQGELVQIDEHYRLDMARIPPAQYDAFAQFAGAVDLLQSRDLIVTK
jgi:tetratricopeptide (TPR) repeat protein